MHRLIILYYWSFSSTKRIFHLTYLSGLNYLFYELIDGSSAPGKVHVKTTRVIISDTQRRALLGKDMVVATATVIILAGTMPPKAKCVWGVRFDKELKGSVSLMAILTGIESEFLLKREKRLGPIKLC